MAADDAKGQLRAYIQDGEIIMAAGNMDMILDAATAWTLGQGLLELSCRLEGLTGPLFIMKPGDY